MIISLADPLGTWDRVLAESPCRSTTSASCEKDSSTFGIQSVDWSVVVVIVAGFIESGVRSVIAQSWADCTSLAPRDSLCDVCGVEMRLNLRRCNAVAERATDCGTYYESSGAGEAADEPANYDTCIRVFLTNRRFTGL